MKAPRSLTLPQAWTEIAGRFAGDPFSEEKVRLSLAEATLSVATEDANEA